MRARLLLVFLAPLASGCVLGPTAGDFGPAHRPAGLEFEVATASVDFQGELLEVRQDALLMRSLLITRDTGRAKLRTSEQQIRLVPFSLIRNATFRQLRSGYHHVQIRKGRAPAAQDRERLRLASRFPYGMEPQVLAALLKAHGQTAPKGIEP